MAARMLLRASILAGLGLALVLGLVVLFLPLRAGRAGGAATPPPEERAPSPEPAAAELAAVGALESATEAPATEGADEIALVTGEVHGRCLARENRRPIADVTIVVASEGFPPLGARTDADGVFRLAYRGSAVAHARARPPPGWVEAAPPLLLSPEQLAGAEEVLLFLTKGPSDVVSGRVVDARTGEGVLGVAVLLESAESALAELVPADTEGVFCSRTAFPMGPLRAEVLDVSLPGTEVEAPAARGAEDAEDEPSSTPGAQAAQLAAQMAALEGLTDAPPKGAGGAGSAGAGEAATQGGSWRGPTKSPALGTFQRVHLEDRRVAGAWLLEVDVGPTYFVVPNDGGTFGGGWTARLEQRPPPPAYAAVLEVHGTSFALVHDELSLEGQQALRSRAELILHERLADLGYTSTEFSGEPAVIVESTVPWPEVPVRTTSDVATPWVRWPRRVHDPVEGLAAFLEVRSADFRGEAEVDGVVGRQAKIVGIELDPIASLAGRVVERNGTPVRGAFLDLRPAHGGYAVPLETGSSDQGGGFSFADLAPGDWDLRVITPEHQPRKVSFVLAPGWNDGDGVVLRRAAPGEVSGSVEIRDGVDPGLLFVALTTPDEVLAPQVVFARHKLSAEGTIFEFAFEDVLGGEYEVSVGQLFLGSRVIPSHFLPPSQRTFAPSGGVDFDAWSTGRPLDVFFEVLDAGSGAPVHSAEVRFTLAGGPFAQVSLADGPRVVMARRDLAWRVTAPGYRPAFGGEAAIEVEDGRGRLEVALQRGWGGTLHLRQASALEMGRWMESTLPSFLAAGTLRGVVVHADGERIGRSDETGRVELALSHPPQRITVECPGWRGALVTYLEQLQPEGHAEGVLWLVPEE